MPVLDKITGASVTRRRRLAWAETDAAGHNHFSQAVRWLEETEHELWRTLGLGELLWKIPRVHLEIDYHERIWPNEEVEVTVGVIAVGRTSCTFGYSACLAESGSLLQEGQWTVVHTPDPQGRAQPWPKEVRERLVTQGARDPH